MFNVIVFLGVFTVFLWICDDADGILWNEDGSDVTVLFLFGYT